MLVHEVMTSEPVTVTPETGVKTALRLLAEHDITAMPVVDEHRRVLGVVSEVDLIRDSVIRDPRAPESAVILEPMEPAHHVDEVFTRSLLAVRSDDDVATAIEVMATTAVKSVVVVDEHGRLAGMLSRSDIVKALARADHVIAADVADIFAQLGRGDWVVEVEDGAVTVTGPANLAEHSLAHVVAHTAPGVVGVRVNDVVGA